MSIRPHTDADGTATTIATSVEPGEIDIALHPLPPADTLKAAWSELESRSDSSFFLSWLWIGPWLALMPKGADPELLVARRAGELVGLAVVCPRRRFGLLRGRRWMLHETGDRVYDRLFMEYNGILADRRFADAVTEAALLWLAGRLGDTDELVLGGLTATAERAARRVAARTGHTLQLRAADSTQWVDLDLVRDGGGRFRDGLGRNTRAAVNRTERLYRARGPLEYRVAATAEEALDYFAALEPLHETGWQARGQTGAFANPAFRPFHERLISAGVPRGAVRLCRVDAGGRAIGYLYNFVHRNRVLNYQGGFAFEPDNRLKPGLLSHVLAIEEALARGEAAYDFMSTAAGHKPLLANADQPMNWLTLGPDCLSRRLEERLRAARRMMADAARRTLRGCAATVTWI